MKTKKTKRALSAESKRLLWELLIAPIFAVCAFLCFVPTFFDFSKANVAGKILMIVCSVAFLCLFVLVIFWLEKSRKDDQEDKWFRIRTYVVIAALYILALLHYFSYTLWGVSNLVQGIVLVTLMLVGIISIIKQYFGKKLNAEVKPILLIGLAVWAFAIAWANYSTNVESATLYLKIALGFCYIIAVALYVYYVFYDTRTDKKANGKTISKIISLVFWAILILISFPFYVRWWGLDDKAMDIFATVYAAIVGGGLTLAGVAWTIQHTNKIRQEDKKNEVKPFFSLLSPLDVRVAEANSHVFHFSTQNKDDESNSIVGNFVNSDKNGFVPQKIIIGEKTYMPDSQYIIIRNQAFQIRIFEDESLDDNCEIVFVVEDQNGNEWSYKLVKSGTFIVSMSALQGENK